MSPSRHIDLDSLATGIESLPGLADVRAAAASSGARVYLVGGAVRDVLLGAEPLDLDLIAIGDPIELAEALGGDTYSHERFATATVVRPYGRINIAAARTETYGSPGALPDVEPAGEIEADLARRDFTVNSIAVALDQPGVAIDPQGGADDLRAGMLRVLHPRSFLDDPTRALRAARYAARLGLELEPRTRALVEATDLSSVSSDRAEAELLRVAAESDPRPAFELLDEWGLIALEPEASERIDAAVELARIEPWADTVRHHDLVLAAAREPSAPILGLAAGEPRSPSAAVSAAAGFGPVELALARVLGATWLDRYISEWRRVELEISGDDLIAAGVSEGPAIGRGLDAALRAKLDGEASGRDDELRLALDAADAR